MENFTLVQFPSGVAIWDEPNALSYVIGRTSIKYLYVLLKNRDQQVQILTPEGVIGWVSECTITRVHM